MRYEIVKTSDFISGDLLFRKIQKMDKTRKRKIHYSVGDRIYSLDTLMREDRVFFVGNGTRKPYLVPKGWYQNWQLRMAHDWIYRGWLCCAIVKEVAK